MKILIGSLFIMLVGGAFFLGRLSSQADFDESVVSGESVPDLVLPTQAAPSDAVAAQRMAYQELQSAYQRLERELAATQEKLNAAEITAGQFAAVREGLLRDGSFSIRFSPFNFSVPTALYGVLNLDEATEQQVEAIFQATFADMRAWERNAAVVQEHTDDMVVYRVPAADSNFTQKLEESLGGVLDAGDRELVMAAFNGSYEAVGNLREISLNLLDQDDPEQIKYSIKAYEIDEQGRRRGGYSSTSTYPRDSPIQIDRWSHLFEIE